MISGCTVGKNREPVVSIVLPDVESALSYSCAEIKNTMQKAGYGTTSCHDFLRKDCQTTDIIREKTNKKRRCFSFFLTMLSQDEQAHLLGCKCFFFIM